MASIADRVAELLRPVAATVGSPPGFGRPLGVQPAVGSAPWSWSQRQPSRSRDRAPLRR